MDEEVSSLRAPYPYFGGKKIVSDVIWHAFGADIANYVEPFCGSCAVLLARPGGAGKIETVNDIHGAIPNFWRAVAADPDEVASWCDWPVSELDIHARHKWLVNRFSDIREQLRSDPEFYDAKAAGWWVYGACAWIGSGWCVEPNNHKHPKLDGIGKGVHSNHGHEPPRQLPALAVPARARTTGIGVHADLHRKLPSLAISDRGHALKEQRPAVNGRSAGMGVHRLPSVGNDRGINGVASPPCTEWFRALQKRLRRVRIVCGDWRRVLGPSVLGKGKNVGGRRPCAVFLDPPYDPALRVGNLYAEDDASVSRDAREWALEHGDDPDLRICLAGYYDEHAAHMPKTWRVHRWKGRRGYAKASNENRQEETLWFSKHCITPTEDAQRSLF